MLLLILHFFYFICYIVFIESVCCDSNIVASAGILLLFPYTFGDIIYPSMFGHMNATISVSINSFGDTKNAVMHATILANIPPK